MNEDKQTDAAVLLAAYRAWSGAARLRAQRQRNKHFTYGDQWRDVMDLGGGRHITEHDFYAQSGHEPVTNNMLRQLVKTVVGRFRKQCHDNGRPVANKALHEALQANEADELDARTLEEFLISGCSIQRVDSEPGLAGCPAMVRPVNLNRFFVNAFADPLGRDVEIVGQLHDLSIASLVQRLSGGDRRHAAWLRRLYTEAADERTAQLVTSLGADSQSGVDFWRPAVAGKCRAIEVWTLESRERLLCHDHKQGRLFAAPVSEERKWKRTAGVTVSWNVATAWRCRWFSPMGDVLAAWDSPYAHGSHPFALKFYPLTDGEVHSFIEDVIDQQKFLNRLITVLDHMMRASAKGVLLFPENALPDGMTWTEVRAIWQQTQGILPYAAVEGQDRPQQVVSNAGNFGAYDMIQLQMRLFEQISGVSGALQGHNLNTQGGAQLYQAQVDNASIALTDIFDTFNHFRAERDRKLSALLPSS